MASLRYDIRKLKSKSSVAAKFSGETKWGCWQDSRSILTTVLFIWNASTGLLWLLRLNIITSSQQNGLRANIIGKLLRCMKRQLGSIHICICSYTCHIQNPDQSTMAAQRPLNSSTLASRASAKDYRTLVVEDACFALKTSGYTDYRPCVAGRVEKGEETRYGP